ncbi:CRISPR-associated endonuclease Cas9 [bioreactor metagenome]|uniref:CRISPR-associated endonuclease Cas9 n=1 Tax=bioreactor metagenome TaxID=1076179 RepID=A0A645BS07_9ZZZZ
MPINGGLAANGDMVRVDVFHVEDDGYYFVPVYVANTKEKELPNKAVVAYKAYEQWKIMKPQDFLFSLYPGDLIRVKSRKGVKLKLVKGGSGEKEIFRKDALYYYRTAGITVGVFQVETHDRRYEQPSLGVKTLELIQKYQVDVLVNCTPVRLPEKRMGFIKTTE